MGARPRTETCFDYRIDWSRLCCQPAGRHVEWDQYLSHEANPFPNTEQNLERLDSKRECHRKCEKQWQWSCLGFRWLVRHHRGARYRLRMGIV